MNPEAPHLDNMKRTLLPPLAFITLLAGFSWRLAAASEGSNAETSNQKTHAVKINIRLADKTLIATLADTPTTADFVALLPLTLTLGDYAGTEKISDLPRKLSTKTGPAGYDPGVGDIAYYAPWGNLAIDYKDFGYSDGLIRLGKIEGAVYPLRTAGPIKATLELAR
ncbi:MAG: hypothetical protein QOE70_513 [Chthoniobacter sp.]|nr:hypothetical protein [Chthoniobacter sp.]